MRLMCTMMERIMREQGMIASNDKVVDNILTAVGIFKGMNLTRFLKIYNEEMLKWGVEEAAKLIALVESLRLGYKKGSRSFKGKIRHRQHLKEHYLMNTTSTICQG